MKPNKVVKGKGAHKPPVGKRKAPGGAGGGGASGGPGGRGNGVGGPGSGVVSKKRPGSKNNFNEYKANHMYPEIEIANNKGRGKLNRQMSGHGGGSRLKNRGHRKENCKEKNLQKF